MNPKISAVKNNFEKDIGKITSLEQVEKVRLKYLGRKGEINKLLLSIRVQPKHNIKKYGRLINILKINIQEKIKNKEEDILNASEKSGWIDTTLPGKKGVVGNIHPLSQTIERISRIFERLGFIRESYKEIEWDYFAFDALNMPSNHPARDDFESLFTDGPSHPKYGKTVLTPHTSNGQVREMWRVKTPPIKMINIGRCYRRDSDATHTPTLHQFEGLCVDKGINITNLKGTIEYFTKQYFGKDHTSRLRPYHFQFTEPSFEVDISCKFCRGKGVLQNKKTCGVCKSSGWLEIGGAGMVHPRVLKEGRIDPVKYSGWAFGFGIERVLMLKVNLDDIRKLYSGKINFLRNF